MVEVLGDTSELRFSFFEGLEPVKVREELFTFQLNSKEECRLQTDGFSSSFIWNHSGPLILLHDNIKAGQDILKMNILTLSLWKNILLSLTDKLL